MTNGAEIKGGVVSWHIQESYLSSSSFLKGLPVAKFKDYLSGEIQARFCYKEEEDLRGSHGMSFV